MLVAVDIGNTNVVLGVFEGETLRVQWRLSTLLHRTQDEWFAQIQTLFTYARLAESVVTGVIISSVVPALTPLFVSLSRERFGIDPAVVSSDLDFGLIIKYDEPSAIGGDRLCNAVGGYEMFGGPLVIIDFGTATTYDIVSHRREYLGGIIAPGVENAARYLHRLTAQLPSVELLFPEKVIATNTIESMQAGIMYGAVASVEGMLTRIREELQETPTVIATGGLAGMICEKTTAISHYEPDLTLIGLEKIYQRTAHLFTGKH